MAFWQRGNLGSYLPVPTAPAWGANSIISSICHLIYPLQSPNPLDVAYRGQKTRNGRTNSFFCRCYPSEPHWSLYGSFTSSPCSSRPLRSHDYPVQQLQGAFGTFKNLFFLKFHISDLYLTKIPVGRFESKQQTMYSLPVTPVGGSVPYIDVNRTNTAVSTAKPISRPARLLEHSTPPISITLHEIHSKH